MTYVAVIILLFYTLLIRFLIVGFDKVTFFNSNNEETKTTFSIIIPFRNEAENLTALLCSLSKLKYPRKLFEIILVNDNSTDDFLSIINEFNLTNLKIITNERKSQSPKKDAINLGVSISKFNWIVSTDADCEVPKNWLNILDFYIQKNDSNMVCGAVKFSSGTSFLNQFQQLNLMSLLSSTIGSFGIKKPIMCNGANLAYRKKIFFELNGFEGNEKISSGDDVFLLEKMLMLKQNKVHYLKSKDFLVVTKPEKNWKEFINQQLRWVSKSGNYKKQFTKLVGVIVFLMNVLIATLFISSFFIAKFVWLLLLLLAVKLIFDFVLIHKSSSFTATKMSVTTYVAAALFYPFFTTYIAFISPFKKFTWKERTYKK
jgi:cellulose synthase/poly-beta-1,6-N-acetylglucosamine synthase-like glycosyltransferase